MTSTMLTCRQLTPSKLCFPRSHCGAVTGKLLLSQSLHSQTFPTVPNAASLILPQRMSVEVSECQFSGWSFSKTGDVLMLFSQLLEDSKAQVIVTYWPGMLSMHCFMSNKYNIIRCMPLYFGCPFIIAVRFPYLT